MSEDMKTIFSGFILILVGLVFMGVLADSQNAATELQTANDSITITSGSGQVSYDETHSLISFGNATNSTDGFGGSIGLEVNLSTNGTIAVDSVRYAGSGPYRARYTFEGDNYVVDGSSRVLIRLMTLFFSIAVMGYGLFMVFNSSGNFKFGFE